MNFCRTCRQDFGSLSAFDRHRVGRHEYDWSVDREDGRRCLDVDELTDRGWKPDQHGRWRTPQNPHLNIAHARRGVARGQLRVTVE